MGLFSGKKKYSFEVAGLCYRFYSIKKKWVHSSRAKTWETFPAQLVPEPTNKHDKNAIQVFVEGIFVGYVPKDLTGKVKEIMSKYTIDEIDADFVGNYSQQEITATITMRYSK